MYEETRTGVLTAKQEDFCAEALDYWFVFKNPLLEKGDKTIFKIIIKTGDNQGLDKLPPEWKKKLIPVIDAAIEKRYDDVRLYVVDLLNEKIDIKQLDDYQEMIVFDQLSRFIALAIDYYVQKKAA